MDGAIEFIKWVREKLGRGEHIERMLVSSAFGELFEWDKWAQEIPALKFDPDWEVRIIPPFAGAVVRFYITKGKNRVSVYLDCYECLGYFGEPHWEIYPDANDNNARFAMADTDSLLAAIRESLSDKG